jgi:tRNA A37 threonylcarbamoyladenosine biosynthesis protein TsaE
VSTKGLPLVHVDVYRLDHLQELHDGIRRAVGGPSVTVVEWVISGALLPAERLDVV